MEVDGPLRQEGREGDRHLRRCKYRTKIETEDGEEQMLQSIRGFRVVYVFDISQTESEEIPDLDAVRPKLLDGEAPEGIWDALVAQRTMLASRSFVTGSAARTSTATCSISRSRCGRRGAGARAQDVVHELAHALLHGDEVVRSREIQEVEVESVAYIVCDALGLDTSDYSFAYVARWSDGLVELVKDTGERVIGCAKLMLQSLEAESASSEDEVSA